MLDIEKDTKNEESIEKEAEIEVVEEKKEDEVEEVKLEIVEVPAVETTEVATVEATDVATVEPEKEDAIIVPVEEADNKKSKKDKKKKKGDNTEVVEVTNVPSEVVTNKETKKSKKFSSFISFTIIVLALLFSIVDWVVESVTKDPQIVLHLMDWIIIMLYLFIAIKALPFINGKKPWVKALYWICVIATLVCILVPMVLDYMELAELVEKNQQAAEQAKATNLFGLVA